MGDPIYSRLVEIKNQYPQLTFDNNGYEYLSNKVKEAHKEVIEELHNILKGVIGGFSEFNNFKPRKDGSFAIRCQYNWGHYEGRNFTGVGYFEIDEFKELP